MYLDTHERDEMERLVMSFHTSWFLYTIKHISDSQAWRLLVLALAYFAGLGTVVWGLDRDERSWAIWVLGGASIVLLQLSYSWCHRQMKQQMINNSLEKWYREIDALDVDSDDRQLFMQLLNAMRSSNSKDMLVSVLEGVLQSPALSQLSFVRELHLHMQ